MDVGLGFLVGIVSGVVSSTIFHFLLRGLKPDIGISPLIAKVDRGGETYYDFKIINKSPRALIDVRAHAHIAEQTYAQGGPIFQTHADYALRFATKSDLDAEWAKDSDHAKLRVIATDSISGFSKAFVHVYTTKRNSIKEGLHMFGENLDVS